MPAFLYDDRHSLDFTEFTKTGPRNMTKLDLQNPEMQGNGEGRPGKLRCRADRKKLKQISATHFLLCLTLLEWCCAQVHSTPQIWNIE